MSKNAYNFNSIDKLVDIVEKYKNPYHRTIKYSIYVEFNTDNNKEDLKFEVGDRVRISKYQHTFTKGYVPNCSA